MSADDKRRRFPVQLKAWVSDRHRKWIDHKIPKSEFSRWLRKILDREMERDP